jgi:hypothetical protein
MNETTETEKYGKVWQSLDQAQDSMIRASSVLAEIDENKQLLEKINGMSLMIGDLANEVWTFTAQAKAVRQM